MFDKSWKRSIIALFPSFVAFFLTFYFKGSKEIAIEIWKTWTPWVGENTPMGLSLSSLSWDTINTLIYHFNLNFIEPISTRVPVPSVVQWCVLTAIVFYLLTTTIYMYDNSAERKEKRVYLVTIALLQFIFMLPLFTVLSCDYLRVVHYWTISTITIYMFIPSDVIMASIPKWFKNMTYNIINYMPESKLLFYITLLLIGAYQHSTMYIGAIG